MTPRGNPSGWECTVLLLPPRASEREDLDLRVRFLLGGVGCEVLGHYFGVRYNNKKNNSGRNWKAVPIQIRIFYRFLG